MRFIKKFIMCIYWLPMTVKVLWKKNGGGWFWLRDCPTEYLNFIVATGNDALNRGKELNDSQQQMYNESKSELKLRNRSN